MENLLLFILGWVIGLAAVGWPLIQVFFSLFVGWPITKRFERIGGVSDGFNPSRRYLVGCSINLMILIGVILAMLYYGSTSFVYGAIVGTTIILFKMIFGVRQAAVEVFQDLQDELNEYGKLVADEDLSRHGIKQ